MPFIVLNGGVTILYIHKFSRFVDGFTMAFPFIDLRFSHISLKKTLIRLSPSRIG